MQLKHPIYDFGAFMLSVHVQEMNELMAAMSLKQDLSEKSKQRMVYFRALVDRFALCVPVLAQWVASAQKLHEDSKADIFSWQQLRTILGGADGAELEYGTGHLLQELAVALEELSERPDGPAKQRGMHVMGGAYAYFYAVFMYFHNTHPYT